MTRYPRWKFVLLMAVIFICGLYAMPNLYPDAPAIQVSANSAGGTVPDVVTERIKQALDEAGFEHGPGERVGNSWLVRMATPESQLHGLDKVKTLLGDDYVVAPNFAPTTPDWLRALGATPMNLGLDLRGGVHFLIQVDTDAAVKQRMEAWSGEAKIAMRDAGLRYRSVDYAGRTMTVSFNDDETMEQAFHLLQTKLPEFAMHRAEEGLALEFQLTETALREIQDYAVDQNRTSLANRVNELGVGEPVVQRQGVDRIVVQLPGVQDAAAARRILGRTATLEFRLGIKDVDPQRLATGIAPPGTEIFPFKGSNTPVVVEKAIIVTGDQVTNAKMGFDQQNGQPEVQIDLDPSGARRMKRITEKNVGNPMAVLFIESRSSNKEVTNADGEKEDTIVTEYDVQVINVATIRDVLSSNFRITGLDSPAEAAELALLLRAGGLAAPMFIIEERTIGPSLGAANIEAGFNSMVLGMVLVLIFMAAWYKVFGLVANIALLGNLVIIIGIMSLIPGATLTLPGIAGIVLTVGMAVDANVLIFEQIRQSLKDGQPPLQAIDAGYSRAFSTIVDANITTIIAAIILFAAGTGTVQGFAVTLFIGILTSMFTAIIGTRSIIEFIYGRGARAPSKLSI